MMAHVLTALAAAGVFVLLVGGPWWVRAWWRRRRDDGAQPLVGECVCGEDDCETPGPERRAAAGRLEIPTATMNGPCFVPTAHGPCAEPDCVEAHRTGSPVERLIAETMDAIEREGPPAPTDEPSDEELERAIADGLDGLEQCPDCDGACFVHDCGDVFCTMRAEHEEPCETCAGTGVVQ